VRPIGLTFALPVGNTIVADDNQTTVWLVIVE
jgi:hypothetical protein